MDKTEGIGQFVVEIAFVDNDYKDITIRRIYDLILTNSDEDDD